MPISIYWDEEHDDILRIDVPQGATWDDFNAMFAEIAVLADGERRYDVIVMSAVNSLLGNTPAHFRRLSQWIESQTHLGLFVMVDPTLAGMVTAMMQGQENRNAKSLMVRALDEAYERISDHRQRRR